MSDAISQARAAELHPVLRERVIATIEDCALIGIYLRITQGKRSPNEQHALYMQGRASLEVVNDLFHAVGWAPITAERNIEVTHADYLDSMHVYGLAADVTPSKPGFPQFNPEWNTQAPQWQTVLAIADSRGLAEGAKWTAKKRDYPHLYPKELDANPTEEMKQTFKDAGLEKVWFSLDGLFPHDPIITT